MEQSDESDKAFAIVAGVSSGEWLFVCEEGNSTACSKGVDISSSARVIPPLKSDIMEALVDLNEYPDAKHVVVKIPSGQQVRIPLYSNLLIFQYALIHQSDARNGV